MQTKKVVGGGEGGGATFERLHIYQHGAMVCND